MSSFSRLTSHAKLSFDEIRCILAAGRADILGRSESAQSAYREAMKPIEAQYENISDYILISKFGFDAQDSHSSNMSDDGNGARNANGIVMDRDEKTKVTNTDLLNNRNKYSIDILEQNVEHLDAKMLLATQTLTPEFCVKYILDLDIESGGEESYIFDTCYILNFQKHITEKELKNLIFGTGKIRAQREDNPSLTPQVLCVPNDFPYNYEDDVASYVIWKYIPPSYQPKNDKEMEGKSEGEGVVTQAELQSCIAQLKRDTYNDKLECVNFLMFESPQHLKSIPDLDHVHLMVRFRERRGPLDGNIVRDSNEKKREEADFDVLLKRIFRHLIISPSPSGLATASTILHQGGLVSFPTETVYGLGANALNEEAVVSIFTAKGRPLTDPLIVHVATVEQALPLIACGGDADSDGTSSDGNGEEEERRKEERALFLSLGAQYWPGPLTIIVPASPLIPPAVTAHTGSVGIRIPSNRTAQFLLRACQLPLAAPSANRFGHVSPTRCVHVLSDLALKGVHVIDDTSNDDGTTTSKEGAAAGGSGNNEREGDGEEEEVCQHGIESTVVKIDSQQRRVLLFRQGAVSRDQLENSLRTFHHQQSASSGGGERKAPWTLQVVQRTVSMHTSSPTQERESNGGDGKEKEATVGQEAPGQAITHYAPDIPCLVVRPPSSPTDTGDTLSLSRADLRERVVMVDFNGKLLHQLGLDPASVLGYRDLSSGGDYRTAARNLFDLLRWSEGYKTQGGRYVLIPSLHSEGEEEGRESELQAGVIDRVFRASSGKTVSIAVLE